MAEPGKCFFDIPIYRCNMDQHTNEIEKERKNYIASRCQFASKLPQETYKQVRTQAENDFNAHHWYPWRYNEIVGWIRLYANGTQFKGELWFIPAKKISRSIVKKKFYLQPRKIVECSFSSDDSSEKIFSTIGTELVQLSNKKIFKKRYIDLEVFQTVGAFINWRQLLGLNND